MCINEVNQNGFSEVLALIKRNGLPIEDISTSTKLFSITKDNEIAGTIGIEFYNQVALLRNLAVTETYRSKGIGGKLVEHIEKIAKQNAVKELILVTTTASDYFSKKAYRTIERNNVPEEIKKSSEFSSTCPSSAVIMKKVL
jgi:amino-acid N-acetyltransferase